MRVITFKSVQIIGISGVHGYPAPELTETVQINVKQLFQRRRMFTSSGRFSKEKKERKRTDHREKINNKYGQSFTGRHPSWQKCHRPPADGDKYTAVVAISPASDSALNLSRGAPFKFNAASGGLLISAGSSVGR